MTADQQIKSITDGAPVSKEVPFYSRYAMQLTEIEQKVLVIAKELMRKHYLLDLKDLHLQTVRILKDYTSFAIQQAIDGLCHKKVLFGGSALTPGVQDFLQRRFGVTTEIANPRTRVAYDPALFAGQDVMKVAPLLTVGIGLALRRVGDKK